MQGDLLTDLLEKNSKGDCPPQEDKDIDITAHEIQFHTRTLRKNACDVWCICVARAGVKILKAPKKAESAARPAFVPESKAAAQKAKPAPKLVSKPAPSKKPEPVKKVWPLLCAPAVPLARHGRAASDMQVRLCGAGQASEAHTCYVHCRRRPWRPAC